VSRWPSCSRVRRPGSSSTAPRKPAVKRTIGCRRG
jgi:hypothetical protein